MLAVEDGSCPEGAQSYVSLEDADKYCLPRNLWAATPVDEAGEADATAMSAKEAALIRAFDYLNGPLEWLGEKIDWQRVPAWPRVNVPVPGTGGKPPQYLPDDLIPEAVKRAQIELAAMIYKGRDMFAPVERGGEYASKSDSSEKTIDVITISESHSLTYRDSAPVEDWLPAVYPLLAPFLAKTPGKAQGGFQVVNVERG